MYANVILDAVEIKVFSRFYKNLMIKWREKVGLINEELDRAMFYKVSLYESLLIKWNRAEEQIFKKKSKKSTRKRRNISIKNMKERDLIESGCTNIPTDIKLHFLRNVIRENVKDFIEKNKKYKYELKDSRKEYIKQVTIKKNYDFEFPEPPKKPQIYSNINFEILKELITRALSCEKNWENIIIEDHKKITRK